MGQAHQKCPLDYIRKNLFDPKIVRFNRDYFRFRTEDRNIPIPAVYQALISKRCECIESYHREGEGPRFLLLGRKKHPPEPLHIVVEIVEEEPVMVLDIHNVYRPDPAIWSNGWRKRKSVYKKTA